MNSPHPQSQLSVPFTVAQIMTPRADLLCWERGAVLEARLVEAKNKGFGILPVTEGPRVVGVLTASDGKEQLLTCDWLVSQDTHLAELLDLFLETGKPALFVLHGQDVVGLVTPADLNKLAMRIHVYGLIGRLEFALAGFVERHLGDMETELELLLSECRWKELQEEREALRQQDMEISWIEYLYLSDLICIVEKRPDLRGRLRYPSKSKAENELGGLNELRKQTMHLVRPLVQNKDEDLATLRSRIARIHATLQSLENQETGAQATECLDDPSPGG